MVNLIIQLLIAASAVGRSVDRLQPAMFAAAGIHLLSILMHVCLLTSDRP